jgi:hypothetical protein
MNNQTAKRLANYYARDAHDHYFSSHRGVWHLEDEDCLLIYNNHPYPIDSLRQNEIERIEKRLQAFGIGTLARGQAGPIVSGDQRYTVSLLLDCSSDRKREVLEIAQAETDESFAMLDELLKNRT